jgi:PAP2 superfamily
MSPAKCGRVINRTKQSHDGARLRTLAVAGALAAGWLGVYVSSRRGTRTERRLRRSITPPNRMVKAAAHVASLPGYPLAYIPAAFLIRRELRRKGALAADAITKSAFATWVAHHALKYVLWRDGDRSVPKFSVVLALPALVGASRLVLDEHWPTDVVGGWLTGIAAASFVLWRREGASL